MVKIRTGEQYVAITNFFRLIESDFNIKSATKAWIEIDNEYEREFNNWCEWCGKNDNKCSCDYPEPDSWDMER